ncbi:MAG: tRNA uridine-5-carboxymethylaminomethyl(34) synthesis GTPase MnmE [Candidatus Omnitrophica bacterium]|nr:tRNA uridine-5-carboxymethylaminomethyl(34) synthesis GTPase MnmE [Candidatus Omnitrophota bacterium]
MLNQGLNDTIVAIATGLGEAGIGIVRLSGKEALKIADSIFYSKNGKKPSTFKAYTMHYGWIVKGSSNNILDEVILTVMRAPKSFTKEDVVEINCHGGIVALRAVLDLVLENGARLAQPGEFTKRAFINGRIDLAQAEAVLDIIRAKTDSALKIGSEQLKGNLSKKINDLREELLDALTILEADIDFPEEEKNAINLKEVSEKLILVSTHLIEILDNSRCGKVAREGVHVVICGKPNVGKSSLLNALLKQERSIVTPVAGTTRDTIEEIIDIRGIPVRIVDTAGILEPRDLIEKKAVERSKQHIKLADLVIILFDASKKLTKEDKAVMEKLKNKQVIAVINKIDLKQVIDKDKISKRFHYCVGISAKKAKNLNLLEDAIVDLVYKGKVVSPESVLVSNARHITELRASQKLIAQALDSLDNKMSLEFIAHDIKEAILRFDYILGKGFQEELLDKIFNEFCIGK